MRGLRRTGLAVLAAALVGPAAAQESANLNLICSGTDIALVTSTTYYDYGYGYIGRYYAPGVAVGQGRIPAQLAVAVEGGKVRVRPPKDSVPLFSRGGKDGWYELSDVAVDRLSIRGRARFSPIERPKLVIDRRTGEATFGGFAGLCQSVSENPSETKF